MWKDQQVDQARSWDSIQTHQIYGAENKNAVVIPTG